jgi:hypothetical protein
MCRSILKDKRKQRSGGAAILVVTMTTCIVEPPYSIPARMPSAVRPQAPRPRSRSGGRAGVSAHVRQRRRATAKDALPARPRNRRPSPRRCTAPHRSGSRAQADETPGMTLSAPLAGGRGGRSDRAYESGRAVSGSCGAPGVSVSDLGQTCQRTAVADAGNFSRRAQWRPRLTRISQDGS